MNKEFSEAIKLLRNTTELLPDIGNEKVEKINNYQSALELLKPIVSKLLDNNMGLLMKVLYRIDVDEEKFKRLLALDEPILLSENVSKLILDRQLQKIYYWNKYSQSSKND